MPFQEAISTMTSVRELMKQYGPFTDKEIDTILKVCGIPDDNKSNGIILITDCGPGLVEYAQEDGPKAGWDDKFTSRVIDFFNRSEWNVANNHGLHEIGSDEDEDDDSAYDSDSKLDIQNRYRVKI